MKKPKIINLFIDAYSELSQLSDAQAGRLIKALLLYADSGDEPDFSDDIAVSVVFSMMRKQVDRDFEKYRDLCERRSAAGKKGGAPLGNTNAAKTSKTSKTSEDKDKDKDEDKDEYEDDDNNKAQSAASSRIIPLEFLSDLFEIVDYLNQRAGTDYRATTFSISKLITDKLREGSTVEDFKKVIDGECERLKDKGVKKGMLPFFLFGSRFDEYAGRS